MLFGAWDQTDSIQFVLTIGEVIWEASLTIYCIVKGFRPTPITEAYDRDAMRVLSDTSTAAGSVIAP